MGASGTSRKKKLSNKQIGKSRTQERTFKVNIYNREVIPRQWMKGLGKLHKRTETKTRVQRPPTFKTQIGVNENWERAVMQKSGKDGVS